MLTFVDTSNKSNGEGPGSQAHRGAKLSAAGGSIGAL